MNLPSLHLASASPRRRQILDGLGLRFSHAGTNIDESRIAGESAADMVLRLALQKARCADRPNDAVLGYDTAVVLGDRVFGKPTSKEDAEDMLAALSGQVHDVLTGIALLHCGSAQQVMCRNRVRFREISRAEASAYWQTGEPLDKAGGYAIQGLAAVFVEELQGSHSGVIGLPVFETAALLRTIGIDVLAGRQD